LEQGYFVLDWGPQEVPLATTNSATTLHLDVLALRVGVGLNNQDLTTMNHFALADEHAHTNRYESV